MQVPLPEQSLTPVQVGVLQSAPLQPASQLHVFGPVQVPLPEQSLMSSQVKVVQSAPVQPESHSHVPQTQVP